MAFIVNAWEHSCHVFQWRNAGIRDAVEASPSVRKGQDIHEVDSFDPRASEPLPDGRNDLAKVQHIMMCVPHASMLWIYNVCSIKLNNRKKMIVGAWHVSRFAVPRKSVTGDKQTQESTAWDFALFDEKANR
jgi:hypothetical protein